MDKLKGALIGFGNVAANGHWPAYSDSSDFEIVAVIDPAPERREAAGKLGAGLRLYSSLEDFLHDKKAPTIDFVDICTPPMSHVKTAQACVGHDWHVLCEKPLALHAADYVLLASHVKRRERTVFAVHNWKYAPIYQKAMEVIQDGRIGRVWHVEHFVLRNSPCKGSSDGLGENVAPPDASAWRTRRDTAGGGILVDHGWHAFYLLLNLIQASPERVASKMHRAAEDPEALEDAAQTLVQFPEADGYIHLTWKARMRRNSTIVQGERGSLLLDDDRLLLNTHGGEREEIVFETPLSGGSHHPDWFRSLLPDFLEEIKNPAIRGRNFREAGWCVALTCAAYESNLRGFQEVAVAFPGEPLEAPALA